MDSHSSAPRSKSTSTSNPDFKVTYPDLPIPAAGQVTEICEGVRWLRMPLPFALNHINLYLLEDDNGWYVVDTGMGDKSTQRHWQQIFAQHLDGKPIKGVILTHFHPDHMGQAGFLSEHWQAPLLMSRTEYFVARSLSGPTTEASQWPVEQYYRNLGLAKGAIDKALDGESGFSAMVLPLPRSFQRLQEGQQLTLKGRQWQVMIGRGHSPEHVCLYCEELALLVSGDHVLPAITPNISVYATEPEANPLADYLHTLQPFGQLPASTLTLPAHGRPFQGLQQRVAYLQAHHQGKLQALLTACQEEATAVALIPAMFSRELKQRELMMGLGECLSHLHYLMAIGQLERRRDEDGAYRYRALVAPAAIEAQMAVDEDIALQV